MADLQARLQKAADEMVAAGTETGLQIAVRRRGQVVADVTAGLADPETGAPVDAGTLFFAASAVKGVAASLAHVLADEQTSMTWAELDHKVNQWIGVLRAHGLRAGDRVAMVLGNRPVTYEVLLACLHTGLVAVPVSWRLTAPELAYLLTDSGAAAVLAEPSTAGRVAAAEEKKSGRPGPAGAAAGGTTAAPTAGRC